MAKNSSSRKKFLQQIGSTAHCYWAPVAWVNWPQQKKMEERVSCNSTNRITANDKIRVAVIGSGIMGFNDIGTALKVPGIEMAAACDLYTGRLERMKELYGKGIVHYPRLPRNTGKKRH